MTLCPTVAVFPKKCQSSLDISMLNRMLSIALIFLSITKNTDQLCKMRNSVIPLWFCHSCSGAFPQNCFPKQHFQKVNSYLTDLSDTSRDIKFYLLTIMGLLKFVVYLKRYIEKQNLEDFFRIKQFQHTFAKINTKVLK